MIKRRALVANFEENAFRAVRPDQYELLSQFLYQQGVKVHSINQTLSGGIMVESGQFYHGRPGEAANSESYKQACREFKLAIAYQLGEAILAVDRKEQFFGPEPVLH